MSNTNQMPRIYHCGICYARGARIGDTQRVWNTGGAHTFRQRPSPRWPRVLKSASASSHRREYSGDGTQHGLRCDVRNTAPAATFLHKKCTGRASDCALLLVQLVEQAEP